MATQPMTFRQQLEDIDLNRVLDRTYASTKLERELLRDQLFDVLAAMLDRQIQYEGAFPNREALEGYLRRATARNAIRHSQRRGRHSPLEEHLLQDDGSSPEQVIQEKLDQTALKEWLHATQKRAQAEESTQSTECQKLLSLLLSDPERYIRKRESGQEAGQWVFQHVQLAEAMGWSRKVLRNRLSLLKQLFFGAKEQRQRETNNRKTP